MSFGGGGSGGNMPQVPGGIVQSPVGNQPLPTGTAPAMPSTGGGFFDPSVSQVGGGNAIPVGNEWSQYLHGIMSQGAQGTPNMNGFGPGANGIQNWVNGGMSMNQTMNMSDALQGMMNGRPGDPTTLGNYFNMGLGSNGMANITPTNASFNPTTMNYVNPAANQTAMQTLMDRQMQQNIGDMRARFGNQALGTGAQVAESNYRAAATPAMSMAMDEIQRQNNTQALAQGQLNNQFDLNSAQMNQQNQQFNTASAMQNQNMGNTWNLGLQNVGVAREGTQAQSQASALQMIMQALMQTQRIGTPQAETAVGPSNGANAINTIGTLGGLGLGMWNAWNSGRGGSNGTTGMSGGTNPAGGPVNTTPQLPAGQAYGNMTPNGAPSMSMVPNGVNASMAPSMGAPTVGGGNTSPFLPGIPGGQFDPSYGPVNGGNPGMQIPNTLPQQFAPQMPPNGGGMNMNNPGQRIYPGGNFANGGFGGGYNPAGTGGGPAYNPAMGGGGMGQPNGIPQAPAPNAPQMQDWGSQYTNPAAGQAYWLNGQQYGQVTPWTPPAAIPSVQLGLPVDGMDMTGLEYIKQLNTPGTDIFKNYNPPGYHWDGQQWTRD